MGSSLTQPRFPQRGGRGRLGLFRQMRIDKLAPRHRAGPEPRGEPIEKLGKRAGALGLMRALEFGFRGRKRLGREAGEAHEVDAIAGVDGVFVRTRQPLSDQPHDRARFIERPGGADSNAPHRAVDAVEAELDPPRALGLPLQEHDEIVGELAQLNLDRLDRLYGRNELPLGAEIRRPEARRDRRTLEAFERVEPRHWNGSEPRRDRRSRPQRDVADASQARPRHVGDGFLVEAERRERQIVKELDERLVAQGLGRGFHPRKPRQRPGRARIAGGADGDGDSLRGEPRATVLDQRRFALEQMGDAGNVEHQPVAPIERGERGIAGAPIAEARQKPRLFRRLSLDHDESRKAGARVGQRKAQAQAEPRGLSVDADQPLRIVDLGDRDKRRRSINAPSRRARSVARRGSQRERNRLVVNGHVL